MHFWVYCSAGADQGDPPPFIYPQQAVISGKYEQAISLLDLGVTIDSSADGQTLLHIAAATNQVTIVLYVLLILKTNPDVQDNT